MRQYLSPHTSVTAWQALQGSYKPAEVAPAASEASAEESQVPKPLLPGPPRHFERSADYTIIAQDLGTFVAMCVSCWAVPGARLFKTIQLEPTHAVFEVLDIRVPVESAKKVPEIFCNLCR